MLTQTLERKTYWDLSSRRRPAAYALGHWVKAIFFTIYEGKWLMLPQTSLIQYLQ